MQAIGMLNSRNVKDLHIEDKTRTMSDRLEESKIS